MWLRLSFVFDFQPRKHWNFCSDEPPKYFGRISWHTPFERSSEFSIWWWQHEKELREACLKLFDYLANMFLNYMNRHISVSETFFWKNFNNFMLEIKLLKQKFFSRSVTSLTRKDVKDMYKINRQRACFLVLRKYWPQIFRLKAFFEIIRIPTGFFSKKFVLWN